MKKIIISILIVILIVIAYFMIFGTFKIGNISIKNIDDIKALDEELKEEIAIANQKTSQEYISEVDKLKNSVKSLTKTKEKYEQYNTQGELGAVELKTYKIEYLWAVIGQYAKKRNTTLTLDLLEASIPDAYNLKFTLLGDYTDIVDFLSDIEDDDSFDFKISNFNLEPYTKVVTKTEIDYKSEIVTVDPKLEAVTPETEKITTTQKINPYDDIEIVKETEDETVASSYNPRQLVATFQINDVRIDFN